MKLVKDKKVLLYVSGIIAGLALIITGLILRSEELNRLAAVCVGGGGTLFPISLGYLGIHILGLKKPEFMRKKNIEVNDERNTIVRDKAAAKTQSLFTWIIFIYLLVFILLDVELYILLSMSGLILINTILYVAYIGYYNKRL